MEQSHLKPLMDPANEEVGQEEVTQVVQPAPENSHQEEESRRRRSTQW